MAFRQFRALRVCATVIGLVGLVGFSLIPADGRDAWGAELLAALSWTLLSHIALLPRIVVTEDGIVGDSFLRRWQIPWRSVARVHARMSIVVELVDGRMIVLRAVERANASLIFKQESVVDRVTVQMDEARTRWQPVADDRVLLHRWPTLLIVYLPLVLALIVRLVVPWT
jgi:hypothetical protein